MGFSFTIYLTFLSILFKDNFFHLGAGILTEDDLQQSLLQANSQLKAQMSHLIGSGTNKLSAPSVIQRHLDHPAEATSFFQSSQSQVYILQFIYLTLLYLNLL